MKKRYILLFALLILTIYPVYNFIMTDQSAYVMTDTFYWDGFKYELSSFAYREGGTIAKTRDGYNINVVIGDSERNAVVIRNFLDQSLYIKEGYYTHVPDKGTVTTVDGPSREITTTAVTQFGLETTNTEICAALSDIHNSDGESFTFMTNNFYENIPYCTTVDLYFENSPLGITRHIGKVDNKWVYIDIFPGESYTGEDPHANEFVAICKVIDERYIAIMEKYFGESTTEFTDVQARN